LKRFFRALVAVTACFHVVVAVALSELVAFVSAHTFAWRDERAPWVAWGVGLAIAAALVALLPGRMALMTRDRPIGSTRRFFERLYFAHWGATLLATALFVPFAVVAIVWNRLSIGRAAWLAEGLALPVGLFATFVRTRLVRTRTLTIPIAGLPEAFEGYRIAHLSDVHIGSLFPKEAARRFIEASNRLDVDLVALTGDYLTSGSRFHADVAELFAALRAKDGVVSVFGNHDNFDGREPLTSMMRDAGIVVLENGVTRVTRGDQSLTIAGVDDIFSRRADVEKTFRSVEKGECVVALVHDPRLFPALAQHGASLVLSGHTHWGQVGLPLAEQRVNLATKVFRFSAGVYWQGSSAMYVHPGIGETGPPLRFGVAPEVTVLELRGAKS
jgi:predicted MPP superfamily phosphohydrolase